MKRNEQRMKKTLGRLRAWARTLLPGHEAWRGAAYGAAALYLCVLTAFALGQAPGDSWGIVTVLGLVVFGGALAFLCGALLDLVVKILNAIPALFRAVLAGTGVLLSMMIFQGKGPLGTALLVAAVVVPGALVGASAWTLARGRWAVLVPRHRAVMVAGAALGAVLLAAGLAWYLWPGPAASPAPIALAGQPAVAALQAQDPSAPGPYTVATLTYGTGTDRRRPEYGEGVALRTGAVDGSALVGNWSGVTGALRSAYWGFDADALPLNARVWYPEPPGGAAEGGGGSFPLALVVHGNHNMFDASDPGYDYLGELLASRGIILVSVDENFLNGGWTDWVMFGTPQELKEENDARGWLLLEHLAQWQHWNTTPGNPFYGKVDMDRVAVMGHSRGGEAAAIAAFFNSLPSYPGDATLAFDYGFGIRSVVAIAPVDGQYRPGGHGTPLQNLSYLVLQGSHDGDMRSFDGLRQFNRLRFDGEGDWFKAAVYFDRANHGQFNTTWGRSDSGAFPGKGLLNLAPIMPEEEQQQIARVLISAFLEATLNDGQEYRPLFRDLRLGQAWLPSTAYVTRYAEPGTVWMATFEEDLNAQTATIPGATAGAENLSQWHEKVVDKKWGDQDTSAVYLGWNRPAGTQHPSYRLDLPVGAYPAGQGDTLVLDLAAGGVYSQSLDLTVEVVDRAGQVARLSLSQFAPLQPQVEFHTLKHRLLEKPGTRSAEPVFQTYEFPLAAFQANNPDLDTGALATIRLVMDESEEGLVILDNVGIRP